MSESVYKERTHILSFIGPESHDPNYDGVVWFLENCWSDLLTRNSAYHLRIIGNWSVNTREKICAQYLNVEFAGFVENLADVLIGTVMIVPIHIGSGIRMKILEAGAIGVPVVSTSVGAEGLPVVDEENILLADTPEMFTEAILRMEDYETRVLLSKQLQRTIRKQYSIDALCENRRNLYL